MKFFATVVYLKMTVLANRESPSYLKYGRILSIETVAVEAVLSRDVVSWAIEEERLHDKTRC